MGKQVSVAVQREYCRLVAEQLLNHLDVGAGRPPPHGADQSIRRGEKVAIEGVGLDPDPLGYVIAGYVTLGYWASLPNEKAPAIERGLLWSEIQVQFSRPRRAQGVLDADALRTDRPTGGRQMRIRLRGGRERFILRKAPDETARDEPQPHMALVGE